MSQNVVFFVEAWDEEEGQLSPGESHHCHQVLRKQTGDQITITNGRGTWAEAQLTHSDKRRCTFRIQSTHTEADKGFRTHLYLAPTKHMDRMEWLVEKLAELNVDSLTLLITEHSERRKIRLDRLEKKTLAALKQSRHGSLMAIHPPLRFAHALHQKDHKFIAFVGDNLPYLSHEIPEKQTIHLMIGPEGDFSVTEVAAAKKADWQLVSLGINILRTETAGLLACHSVNVCNSY